MNDKEIGYDENSICRIQCVPEQHRHLPHTGYMLRIDCDKAEDGIKTTPCSQCALNALAIDEPLEYAKLYLDGTMQIWVDTEDSIEL